MRSLTKPGLAALLLAGLVWRGFYLTQLLGFKNRLAVLVEWTSAYLGHRVTARLPLGLSSAAGTAAPAAPRSGYASAEPSPSGSSTSTPRSRRS